MELVLAAGLDGTFLLGIAAVLTALAGLITTLLAVRKSREDQKKRDEDDCHKKLLAMTRESEEFAIRLHELTLTQQGFKSLETEELRLHYDRVEEIEPMTEQPTAELTIEPEEPPS